MKLTGDKRNKKLLLTDKTDSHVGAGPEWIDAVYDHLYYKRRECDALKQALRYVRS